jgi:hypothetical protein
MSCTLHFDRRPGEAISLGRLQYPLLLLAMILLCRTPAQAQAWQSGVGSIEGTDVSISSGGAPGVSLGRNGPAPVTDGSIVTVHSGQARLMLTSGGEIDICAPAKFTLLQSGDATTLALDFGRVRVQLPASSNLRVFTPTIIATPIDINSAPRDVTVGLELDDSLCVKAATGALLLENQFSAEKLIVPQAGEFFLAPGKLAPVVRADATCDCVMNVARAVAPSPPLPSLGLTAPAHTEPTPESTSPGASDADPSPDKPNVEFSTLAQANEAHPINPRPKTTAPDPPPDSTPTYKIVMPPLTFSASSPATPPEPRSDMVLLIRTVEVQPEWEFKGRVDTPSLDEQTKGHNASKRPHGRQPKLEGEKPGFWVKVKRFFSVGNS